MNVPQPFDKKGVLENILVWKTSRQVQRIVNAVASGQFIAYVIVEGFLGFYRAVAKNLYGTEELNKHKSQFDGTSVNNFFIAVPKTLTKDFRNSVGIIVNERYCNVRYSDSITVNYKEEGYEKVLRLTMAAVKVIKSKQKLLIVGVHVSGCNSQFPRNGLLKLTEELLKLRVTFKGCDVLALGDYNTTPSHVDETVIAQIPGAQRLPPSYFTHANPNCEAGVYDHAVFIPAFFCTLEPAEKVNNSLIAAIQRSVNQYDEKMEEQCRIEVEKFYSDYVNGQQEVGDEIKK